MSKHTRDIDGERPYKIQRVEEPTLNILCVPLEIHHRVASYLDVSQLHTLRFTCKQFRSAVSSFAVQQRLKFNRSGFMKSATCLTLSLVKWAHDTGFALKITRVLREAVMSKNLELVQWTVENGDLDLGLLKWCFTFAQFGNVEIVQYLFKRKFPFCKRFVFLALEGGNFEVFNWAKTNLPWSTIEFGTAMATGNLEIVKELYHASKAQSCDKESLPIISESDLVSAAKAGKHEILEYVISNFHCAKLNSSVMAAAAFSGNLKLISWLRERGCEWDESSCQGAAGGGHIETLKYLREHGCPWDVKTLITAKSCKQYDVVKWVLENGCPYDISLVELLSMSVDLLDWGEKRNFDYSSFSSSIILFCRSMDVINWFDDRGLMPKDFFLEIFDIGLRKNLYDENFVGCKWVTDSNASEALKGAIIYGKMNVAKWILSNFKSASCTADFDDCKKMVKEGNLEFLKFLKAENVILCNNSLDNAKFYYSACAHKHIFQWLYEIGIPFPVASNSRDLTSLLAYEEQTSLCKWVIENGYLPSKATFYAAISTENCELVEYLLAKRCEFDPNFAMNLATKGSIFFLEFLKSLNQITMSMSIAWTAVRYVKYTAFKWLVENGCPWDPKLCYKHAKPCNFIICEWIEQKAGGIEKLRSEDDF